ncbi:hypothetical protein SAMN05444157_0925 [Frankineae bacterium MT45]|nr:hypothetical protein SAMN05444157_0925 [Frankineae bacterium MT45]
MPYTPMSFRAVFASASAGVLLAATLLFAAPANAIAPDTSVTVPGHAPASASRGNTVVPAFLEFAFTVSDPSVPSSLAITVPTGVTLSSFTSGTSTITCPAVANVYTCNMGAVGSGQLFFNASVSATVAIGTVESVQAHITTTAGPDSTPSDNTATTSFTVVGNAVLHDLITPNPAKVSVGATTKLHAVIRNDGPDPATGVSMKIVPPGGSGVVSFVAFSASTVVRNGSSNVTWPVGTIPAGATASLDITVKGLKAANRFAIGYGTTATTGDAVCHNRACESAILINVTAPVAATAVKATPAPVVADPAPAAELSNTGAPTGKLTGVAALLLLAGIWLTVAGRRRRA